MKKQLQKFKGYFIFDDGNLISISEQGAKQITKIS